MKIFSLQMGLESCLQIPHECFQWAKIRLVVFDVRGVTPEERV